MESDILISIRQRQLMWLPWQAEKQKDWQGFPLPVAGFKTQNVTVLGLVLGTHGNQ